MRCRWLGWAGVEVSAADARILIDPLVNPRAVFAAAGERAAGAPMPDLVDAGDGPPVVATLISHLHRDHADAEAIPPGTEVFGPQAVRGADALAEAGVAQAREELAAAGVTVRETAAWQRFSLGAFTITALPAADGTGDPQVSWAVEVDGRRVLHCGDTMFHGWWWRMARLAGPFDAVFVPINGAVLGFPWRQPASPLPAVMTAEQALVAAQVLSAETAVPMHYGAFDLEPFYRSSPDALSRFMAGAEREGVRVRALAPGGVLEPEPAAV